MEALFWEQIFYKVEMKHSLLHSVFIILIVCALFLSRFAFQCAVIGLSARGAREGISEFDFLRHHIAGQHFFAVFKNLLLGGVGFFTAGLQHDKRLGNIDSLLVRHADNAAQSDRSVGVNRFFNAVPHGAVGQYGARAPGQAEGPENRRSGHRYAADIRGPLRRAGRPA